MGRKPRETYEKRLWKLFYAEGMKNGWASGRYAIQDGNYIVKEDRLNKNSIAVFSDIKELKHFFRMGNWCLGQAVMYGDLCFIQQVNAGDEWLTLKYFSKEGVLAFESVSFNHFGESKFEDFIQRIEKASYQQCKELRY